jgi:GT2 family glycosyltransferase
VNWNSAEYVRKCLTSLYRENQNLQIETIVVDNGSHDGCGEMIANEFPNVRFIQSEANLGFGIANNNAFVLSRGEAVLFLNPDTEVCDGAIKRMLQVLRENSDAGVIGSKLLNSDGSIQTSCIQAYPSIVRILLDSELLRNWYPQWSLWGMRPLFANLPCPVEVNVISGACQMVRRDAFLKAQMYSSAYFMYSEDVDLCLRMNQLGLKNLYVPDSLVIHHGGKSISASSRNGWAAIVMRESLKRLFEEHKGDTYARLFQVTVAFQASLRVLLISAAIIGTRITGGGKDLGMIQRKWISILRWALGLEGWASRLRTCESKLVPE